MLGLTMFDYVSPNQFLIELNSLVSVMIILLNVQALSMYCRNAGNPYLNDKYKRYVRRYKCVVIFWNFAFICKFFLTTAGATIADIEEQGETSDDFWYSVE